MGECYFSIKSTSDGEKQSTSPLWLPDLHCDPVYWYHALNNFFKNPKALIILWILRKYCVIRGGTFK